jgi:hypothetical protein
MLDRISKITDFYIKLIKLVADNVIPLRDTCKYFTDDICRWQGSYYFVLKRLEAENGHPFQEPLADFS